MSQSFPFSFRFSFSRPHLYSRYSLFILSSAVFTVSRYKMFCRFGNNHKFFSLCIANWKWKQVRVYFLFRVLISRRLKLLTQVLPKWFLNAFFTIIFNVNFIRVFEFFYYESLILTYYFFVLHTYTKFQYFHSNG